MEWYRDLAIIVCGVISTVVLVVCSVLLVVLYRRLTKLMTSMRTATDNLEEISSVAKDKIVEPLAQVGVAVLSLSRWVDTVGDFIRRPRKEPDGKTEKSTKSENTQEEKHE